MAESQPAAPTMGEGMTAQMSIEQIYVKDLSLENPGSPQSFQMTEAPQVEVGLRTRAEQVAPDVYECVLTLTVTARDGRQDGCSSSRRRRRASSRIRGIPPDQLQPVLAIHCPTVLFPYARETHRRRDDARGLSAGASRADQLRGALPAAAGPGGCAAGALPAN